jgi:hypothetical protein
MAKQSHKSQRRSVVRLISSFVTSEIAAVRVPPTTPALRQPCGGRDWLAAGAAAVVLDPLCGTAPGFSFAPADDLGSKGL